MSDGAARVLTHVPDGLLAPVRERFPDVTVQAVPEQGAPPEGTQGDVLLTYTWASPNFAQVVARGVRWVHCFGTGVDAFPFDALGDRELTCSRGASAVPISEWVLAVMLGRLAVGVACGPWFRPARPDGLGALVIGSMSASRLVTAGLLSGGVAVVATLAGPLPWSGSLLWGPVAAVGVALWLGRLARRRFGGSTGDVLGGTAELATTAVLLVLALR